MIKHKKVNGRYRLKATSHVNVRRLAKRLQSIKDSQFLFQILPLGILKTFLVKTLISPLTHRTRIRAIVMATSHLTISMSGQHATGKIQKIIAITGIAGRL